MEGDNQRRLREAAIEEIYQRDVASVLDPPAEKARATIKEIRQLSPTVSGRAPQL